MFPPLTRPEIRSLERHADRVGRRIVRTTRSPRSERDDIRQDLLVGLLTRLKFFEPARGTLGGFAIVCFQHHAARLGTRVRRERSLRYPVSLDSSYPGTEGLPLGDTFAVEDGYAAWVGQPSGPYAAVERRLDLDRALATLSEEQLRHCAALARRERGDRPDAVLGPRTTAFRRTRELRLRLLAAGISAAA